MKAKKPPSSKEIIGDVKERFKELEHKGLDWKSFYSGWIEGRTSILEEKIKK